MPRPLAALAALCAFAALALCAGVSPGAMPPPAAPPRHRDRPPRRTSGGGGGHRGGNQCRLALRASSSAGAESCFTDDRVGGRAGVLVYDCSGEGAAEATFGGAHFTGSVSGGHVALRLATRFHFSDGCDWQSEQEIRGDVATRAFEFEYREAPAGSQSPCAEPCHAVASVTAAP